MIIIARILLASSCHVVAMTLEDNMERQDASIKKMAKALREGARMLDIACPICNNPIFQYKSGEKVCVSCERKVIFEGEAPKKNNDAPVKDLAMKQEPTKNIQHIHADGGPHPVHALLIMLKERCTDKLASLVTKMEQTTDENELSIIYANILKIIDILRQSSLF